jgi:hypothetical protein
MIMLIVDGICFPSQRLLFPTSKFEETASPFVEIPEMKFWFGEHNAIDDVNASKDGRFSPPIKKNIDLLKLNMHHSANASSVSSSLTRSHSARSGNTFSLRSMLPSFFNSYPADPSHAWSLGSCFLADDCLTFVHACILYSLGPSYVCHPNAETWDRTTLEVLLFHLFFIFFLIL